MPVIAAGISRLQTAAQLNDHTVRSALQKGPDEPIYIGGPGGGGQQYTGSGRPSQAGRKAVSFSVPAPLDRTGSAGSTRWHRSCPAWGQTACLPQRLTLTKQHPSCFPDCFLPTSCLEDTSIILASRRWDQKPLLGYPCVGHSDSPSPAVFAQRHPHHLDYRSDNLRTNTYAAHFLTVHQNISMSSPSPAWAAARIGHIKNGHWSKCSGRA